MGSRRWAGVRGLRVTVLAAVAACMLFPSALIGVLSFSGDAFIKFPPRTWGWRHYASVAQAEKWRGPFLRSLLVAGVASPLAVAVGVAATVALHRTGLPGRHLLQMAGIAPLLLPGVAYAIAVYSLFAWLKLLNRVESVILTHVTHAVPFVLLITGAAFSRVPRELELAALSLGASRLQAWWDVTLPLLGPAIVASLIFAFKSSLDETVITSFLAAPGFETLPVAIFNSVREGTDPVIMAIATPLTLFTGALLVAYTLLRRSE